ncbi:hypothetical protein [Streptomyces sp. NPDC093149]|uniref:hypothetical protein n=1 Tax=Streptomyces sp. NPDC093149 TaxID=3366031 RepID=UPI003813C7AF
MDPIIKLPVLRGSGPGVAQPSGPESWYGGQRAASSGIGEDRAARRSRPPFAVFAAFAVVVEHPPADRRRWCSLIALVIILLRSDQCSFGFIRIHSCSFARWLEFEDFLAVEG